MSRILIIGAGWEQCALLEAIKAEGHYVIATHPQLNAEGFQLADKFFVKASDDIQGHLAIAESNRIDGVVTDNCDYSFYTASILASKLKLPFAPVRSAVFSNDKYAQRDQCRSSAVRQPEYRLCRTPEELESAIGEIGFPAILKPVDSRGTFGVNILQGREELEKAFHEAVHYSPARRLICEAFIAGTLVTVDGFCFKNGHQALAVASRKFEAGAKPVTKEIVYPARFPDELNDRLMSVHEDVVRSLGYEYGHTHGEYIVNREGEIYLVECTNRGGGVYTSSSIVPLLTSLDLNRLLLQQSLGSDDFQAPQKGLAWMGRAVMLTFLDYEVGKVIESINEAEMRQLPFTVKFRSIYGENDMVESIENCASRHSMLVLQGESVGELLENFRLFQEKLAIAYHE